MDCEDCGDIGHLAGRYSRALTIGVRVSLVRTNSRRRRFAIGGHGVDQAFVAGDDRKGPLSIEGNAAGILGYQRNAGVRSFLVARNAAAGFFC